MHQRILFSVFSITLLSIGGFISVLTSVDPYYTSFSTQFTFYLLIVAIIWGLGSMALYFKRKKDNPTKLINILWESMRQSFIVAVGIVGLIFFQTLNVLNILSATVYVIALILIELYFRLRYNAYA